MCQLSNAVLGGRLISLQSRKKRVENIQIQPPPHFAKINLKSAMK